MDNYRTDVYRNREYYWSVDIFKGSDLIKSFTTCETQREAEVMGYAFIEGVKLARGE